MSLLLYDLNGIGEQHSGRDFVKCVTPFLMMFIGAKKIQKNLTDIHINAMDAFTNQNYRVDILKVKQKIFDSHPENSEARKLMLKKEQLNELNSLTVASNFLYPEDAVKHMMQAVRQKITDCLSLGSAGIMLILIMFGGKILFPITSAFGQICFYTINGVIGILSLMYLYESFNGIKAIRNTKKARKQMQDRIRELKDKIFGDI